MRPPVGGAGEPLTLVQKCIEHRAAQLALPPGERWRDGDQVWAVFDRDEHHYFYQAITLAREQGVNLAISNPCIEVWGLLHIDVCDQPMTRHEAQRHAKDTLPNFDHGKKPILDWSFCGTRWRAATENASRTLRTRKAEGTDFPDANPSSNFHCLLMALMGRDRERDHNQPPRAVDLVEPAA